MEPPRSSRSLAQRQQSSVYAPVSSASGHSREEVLQRLENFTLSFTKQLTELLALVEEGAVDAEQVAAIELKHARTVRNAPQQSAQQEVESDEELDVQGGSTKLVFPRVAVTHTTRLAQALKVATEMYEAVLARTVVTKRDIYYRSPRLFTHQRVVDRLVDALSTTLNTPSVSLGVVAASKGLFAGHIEVTLRDEEKISLVAMEQGAKKALIPHTHDIKALKTAAKWVLVVEKDAVFATLCEQGCAGRGLGLEGKGIIVTGKGYPDAATRRFLWLLQAKFINLPFYALVDADPSGLDIARCYLMGTRSKVLADGKELALPSLQLLRPTVGDYTVENSPFHLQMTAFDRSKAISLLRTHADTLPEAWKRDLSGMLWTGKKAET